jgi:hypothetical protein
MKNKPMSLHTFQLDKNILFAACLCMLFIANNAFSDVEIRYALTGTDIERNKYKTDLVKLVLDHSGIDYNLYYYPGKGNHAKQVEALRTGKITIRTFGARKDLEETLIPIRIPIFKGLLGYRIFLINKNDQYKFESITRLEDLRHLTGIQGVGWIDLRIMEDAGLPQRAEDGQNIYRMLNRGGRVDYFSRAVYEAVGELQTLKTTYPNIVIEKRILLKYPFAMYFYVTPKQPELAEKIRQGFEALVRSGEFDTFFYTNPYILSAIAKAKLTERIKIEIPNRYLSQETKSLPDTYWIDMKRFHTHSSNHH